MRSPYQEILNKMDEIETTSLKKKWSYNTMWYILKSHIHLLIEDERKHGMEAVEEI